MVTKSDNDSVVTVPAAVQRFGVEALDDIRARLAVSDVELAALFGVSRAAITKWRQHGVPVARTADVAHLGELAAYLGLRFSAARIPQIVRTPGKALAGKTVLAALAEGGVDQVYTYLERLFSYLPS